MSHKCDVRSRTIWEAALQENWVGALRVIERTGLQPKGREHFKKEEFVQQCSRQQRSRTTRVEVRLWISQLDRTYSGLFGILLTKVMWADYISFQQFLLGIVSLHSYQHSIDNYLLSSSWCNWGLFITSYFVDFIRNQKSHCLLVTNKI